METETQGPNIDLIDDLWLKIFSSLDCQRRGSLFQVSRRWNAMASNPLCWIALDLTLSDSVEDRISVFSKFVARYCSLTTKVSIKLQVPTLFPPVLRALCPLRHLRYLKISIKSTNWERPEIARESFPKPSWDNLVYLNLQLLECSLIFPDWMWMMLTKASPNLEELHLASSQVRMTSQTFLDGLANCPKIKMLTMPDLSYMSTSHVDPGLQLRQLVIMEGVYERLPDLKVVIVNDTRENFGGINAPFAVQPPPLFGGAQPFGGGFGGGFGQPAPLIGGTAQPQELQLEYHNSTLILNQSVLSSRDVETLRKVAHVLKRTNYYGCFLRRDNAPLTEPVLHYLVNELKLDINCSSTQETDPFSIDVFQTNESIPVLPLTAALNDVEQVELLLNFGADPNYPDEGVSPLASANLSKDSCILLLERGADPMKPITENTVIGDWFARYSDPELLEIMLVAFNKGVDVNHIVDGSNSLVDLAIDFSRQQTLQALLTRGASWTPRAMERLIHRNIDLWTDVITSGQFDISKLLLSTVLEAIKKDKYSLVREYLQNIPRGLDQNGFGLVHYLSLLAQNVGPSIVVQRSVAQNGGPPNAFGFGTVASAGPFIRAENPAAPEKSQLLGQMIKELSLDVNLKTSSDETPLLLACCDVASKASVVQVLLDSGALINGPDIHGWTPLHAAISLHKASLMQLLLSRGANINAQDKFGVTPVMAFCISDNTEATEGIWNTIVEHGFDATLRDNVLNRSILHYLAALPNAKRLELLLNTVPGLDINCRDVHGFTPLHYAAKSELRDTTSVLLEHGADTNAMSYTLKLTPFTVGLYQKSSQSPYHQYLENYRMNKVFKVIEEKHIVMGPEGKTILCTCAKPCWSIVTSERRKHTNGGLRTFGGPSHHIFIWPTDLSLTDELGNNVLHTLVLAGVAESSCALLIQEDENRRKELNKLWSKPNKRGTTPFHTLTKYMQYLQDHAFLAELVDTQPDELIYSLNNKDEHGQTALEYIFNSELGHEIGPAVFKIQGLHITNTTLPEPSSLLHSAIDHSTLIPELLIRLNETDANALNMKVNGKTPLILFIEKLVSSHSFSFVAGAVLGSGVDLNAQQAELIDSFLACKVDLNAQDNEGNTALHYACYFFHLGAWEDYHFYLSTLSSSARFSVPLFKLLEAGARVDIKNNEGKTALDILPNLLQLDRSLVQLAEQRKAERQQEKPAKSSQKGSQRFVSSTTSSTAFYN